MNRKFFLILAGVLLFCAPVFAHHGYGAYDMTASRTVKGTITSFTLANPHSRVMFDTKNAAGVVEHWTLETGPAVRGMKAAGWAFNSIKPGDDLTISFHPSKNGAPVGVLIKVVFPDGHALPGKTAPNEPGN
ncbi:MAG TPA: DUF6152 family protein [Terriglobales bacterium]|jgi:hypothetical protein|nr:DUF6152 family protein [Terriglobales bacterium]